MEILGTGREFPIKQGARRCVAWLYSSHCFRLHRRWATHATAGGCFRSIGGLANDDLLAFVQAGLNLGIDVGVQPDIHPFFRGFVVFTQNQHFILTLCIFLTQGRGWDDQHLLGRVDDDGHLRGHGGAQFAVRIRNVQQAIVVNG